jgi:hypothetical protein
VLTKLFDEIVDEYCSDEKLHWLNESDKPVDAGDRKKPYSAPPRIE